MLAEQGETDKRADRRFEAQQHPERLPRQVAQREDLERIGHRARQDRDENAAREQRGLQQGRARAGHAERQHDERADTEAQRDRLAAVEVADALSEQDVERPEHRRGEREGDADEIERVGPGERRQQREAGDGECDPEEIARPGSRRRAPPRGGR